MARHAGFALAALVVFAATAAAPVARGGDELDGANARKAQPEAGLREVREVAKDLDAALARAWKEQGLTPTSRCSDEAFVRRVYLDLVGTIPTAEQVDAFLDDLRFEKREKLVDALIKTPGYSRHFADLWAEVLVGSGGNEKDKDYAPAIFRPWLEKELVARRPYSELVSSILTATGTLYSNPAVNFYGRSDFNATDLAGRVSQAFLGVRVQCAQCHDHPYEEIKQKDFQGMAAFFARMTLRPAEIPYEMLGERAMKANEKREEDRAKELMKNNPNLTEEQARIEARKQRAKTTEVGEISGEASFPRRMKENAKRLERIPAEVASATPKFLLSVEYRDAPGATRRKALADWIANPANDYASRALANRYWGWFLGRGFVDPVDDFSSVNIATVPEALELLARDTAQSGFDFDRLVRVITSTKAYQLSSASGKRDRKGRDFFAVGPLKQFTPQQTFDSLQVALGLVEDPTLMSDVNGDAPSAVEMAGGRFGRTAMDSGETKDANKLQLAAAARTFFKTFDDDEGGGVTSFEGTVPQGLFLLNSPVVNGLLSNPNQSVLPKIVEKYDSERARIRHLFVRTLSRAPTEKEMTRFVDFVKTPPQQGASNSGAGKNDSKNDKRAPRRPFGPPELAAVAPYADALWALVSSSEFATNH